jgi:hypothetical protein
MAREATSRTGFCGVLPFVALIPRSRVLFEQLQQIRMVAGSSSNLVRSGIDTPE